MCNNILDVELPRDVINILHISPLNSSKHDDGVPSENIKLGLVLGCGPDENQIKECLETLAFNIGILCSAVCFPCPN